MRARVAVVTARGERITGKAKTLTEEQFEEIEDTFLGLLSKGGAVSVTTVEGTKVLVPNGSIDQLVLERL